MMAQSFDVVQDGLGALAMPVVLNELLSSSVLDSLPTSGTSFGDVFTELRNGLHREGSAHKKSYTALRDEVQSLIDQTEAQGLGGKKAVSTATKLKAAKAVEGMEKATPAVVASLKRKRGTKPVWTAPPAADAVSTCYYCHKPGHRFEDCRKYARDLESGVTQPLTLGLSSKTASPPSKRLKPAEKASSAEDQEDEPATTLAVAKSLAQVRTQSLNTANSHTSHARKLNWVRQRSEVVLGERRLGEMEKRIGVFGESREDGVPLFEAMNKGVIVGRGLRIVHHSNIMLDSGATSIMSPDKTLFSNLVDSTDHYVLLGDDSPVPVKGVGTIIMNLQGHECRIRKALYVPALV